MQILCVLKHVGDVEDVIYINKRSNAALNRAMLLMSEMWNISTKDLRLCNYFHVKGVKDSVKYELLIKGDVCRRCQRWLELHCVCNAVYVGDVEDIERCFCL